MTTVPLITITRPEEIVAAAPHLVGFLPKESVVVIVLSDRAVVVTARIDAPPLELAGAMPAQIIENVIVPVSEQAEVTGIVVIGYDERGVAAAQAVADAIPLFDEMEITVRDVIAVEGPMWRGLSCPEDCDGCGGIIAYDAAINAEFVGLGSAAPSVTRAQIEQGMTPQPIPLPEGDPGSARAMVAWRNILTGQWKPDDLASVTACECLGVRDAFLVGYVGSWAMHPNLGNPMDEIDPAIGRWAHGLPRLRSEEVLANLLSAAVAGNTPILWTAYASMAWRVGDGARARLALDHALKQGYRLALLTERLIDVAARFDGTPMWEA